MTAAPIEVQLRQAVEAIVNDRKGLHWDCIDDEALTELRSDVERSFTAILGADRATEPPAPDLPTVGGFVQLPRAWHSSAGIIQNLVEHACGGVGIITSRKGATRASHWHREDWHYLYVVSGLLLYEEWQAFGVPAIDVAVGSGITTVTVGPGQMIFTPPLRAHRVTFLEDTVMISISKLSRRHAEHEEDVVRL